MPRVRILPAIQYTSYDHAPGDEVDLPADIAATWCNAGLAELVRGQDAETPEQAEGGEQPETTAARPRSARGRKQQST